MPVINLMCVYIFSSMLHVIQNLITALWMVASHAVVFRGLVLPAPHKHLLTQVPHSFPIVLLLKHPCQLPSRHCLMMSNQIVLPFPASFVQSLVQSWEMWEFSWNKYIFFTSGMAGQGWNAKTNIESEYKHFLCDVLIPLSAGRVKIFGKV